MILGPHEGRAVQACRRDLMPPEAEVMRPRSTNTDVFMRPAAAYRALELFT